IAHAKKRSMPSSLKPQLCTLVNEVPTGGEWLHEIKFDGYRIVAFIKGGKVKLVSRNGKVWADKFPNVAKACEAVGHDCVLDGEVVVVRADGTTDFQALQNVLKSRDRSNLAYYVFDITH